MSETRFEVKIPSTRDFISTWNNWIIGKVNKQFKRNKDRVPDFIQEVYIRLLQKNFVERWFYKYLTDEYVNEEQVCKILGISKGEAPKGFHPSIVGENKQDSLWKISDILKSTNFCHESYFYSPQNHTIPTSKVLKLLGHKDDEFGALESLYRQGRLYPSELTEHDCKRNRTITNNSDISSSHKGECHLCEKGKASLKKNGLSLANRWVDNPKEALKLRWNDSQLAPLIKSYRRKSWIKTIPDYIIRFKDHNIQAGLLKYAEILISNSVRNKFKSMKNREDVEEFALQNSKAPEFSNNDLFSLEVNEDDEVKRVLVDTNSTTPFASVEMEIDINALMSLARLSSQEIQVVQSISLREQNIQDYSRQTGMPVQTIQEIHDDSLNKLRKAAQKQKLALGYLST